MYTAESRENWPLYQRASLIYTHLSSLFSLSLYVYNTILIDSLPSRPSITAGPVSYRGSVSYPRAPPHTRFYNRFNIVVDNAVRTYTTALQKSYINHRVSSPRELPVHSGMLSRVDEVNRHMSRHSLLRFLRSGIRALLPLPAVVAGVCGCCCCCCPLLGVVDWVAEVSSELLRE